MLAAAFLAPLPRTKLVLGSNVKNELNKIDLNKFLAPLSGIELVLDSNVRNELNKIGLNKFLASLLRIEVEFKDQYSSHKENL